MPRINLLPWRAELREKRKKDFLTAVLAALLFGGLGVYGAKLTVKSWIAAQDGRNTMLRNEIVALDQQIVEINTLEEQKNNLLERMEIVEQLQHARPEVVHLFDEIVDVVPAGLYLTSMRQTGAQIEFQGDAESNSRVSDLLRGIDESRSLKDSGNVKKIEASQGSSQRFQVTAMQVPAQSAASGNAAAPGNPAAQASSGAPGSPR